eukprot:TRINITY_DN1526_c0_g1_i1.p1 TRINITY_DN1526_c0_g1~~TRINITY_DN1526_c0_g1_i1.p1  ORF type:complete len:367 (-),score=41.70 TRINITY_DN1526_c0_g1_i1:418-1518(-)
MYTQLALPSALTYTSNTGYGNGILSVYVVNNLTVPNDTIDNNISVNVFVSAGDDFEVAQPEQFAVSRLRLTEPQSEEVISNSIRQQRFKTMKTLILPQSEEISNDEHVVPLNPGVIHKMAQGSDLVSPINHIHYGETIGSFRTMMKRYNLTEMIGAPSDSDPGSPGVLELVRPSRPITPGYTAVAGPLTYTLPGGEYVYGYMTLLNYVTYAYGGWRGSTRFFLDASTYVTPLSQHTLIVCRDNGRATPGNGSRTFGSSDSTTGMKALVDAFGRANGQNGDTLQCANINPTVSFEVPYYSNQRFTPAKVKPRYNDDFEDQADFRMLINGVQPALDTHLKLYSCAGEDFNCFFYLGPPIFYFELVIPS